MDKNKDLHIIILLLFVICGIALLFQHSLVFLYFDDFGNASLTYGYDAGIAGTAWSISDLIAWVQWNYNNWGGRVLYAATILFPLIRESAAPFMLLQAIVITVILYYIYKIICNIMDNQDNILIAFFVIIGYGLIGQDIHKNGTYWASASVLYIWPLLPFLLSALYYLITIEKQEKNKEYSYLKYMSIQILLVFYATFSQEQAGLIVVVFYVLMPILHHIKDWKKFIKIDTIMIGTAIFSYIILFFAPGNFTRLNTTEFSQLGLIEKIIYNYPKVINGFFFDGLKWFNILLAIGMIYLSIKLLKRVKLAPPLIITSAFQLAVSFEKAGVFDLGFASVGWMSLAIINIIVVTSIYFWINNKTTVIALMYAGGASVLCLLYSPTIAERSYIGYIFFVIMLCGIILNDMILNVSAKKGIIGLVYFSIAIVAIISVNNFTKIYNGYNSNAFHCKYNHEKLSDYQGENVISLVKLPNLWYAGEMPYTEGFDFIEYWMREYYDIPSGVTFVWSDFVLNTSITKTGEFYPDGWFGKIGEIILRDWGKDVAELSIAGLYPTMDDNKLIITVNGDKQTYDIPSGNSSILLDVPKDGIVNITVEAETVIVPKEIGAGEDTRNMSMLLSVK